MTSKPRQVTLRVNQTDISPDTDVMLQRDLARFQFYYSIAGLILGLLCMIGGITLFVLGVTGASDWYTNIWGAESRISQAAPGAILFIIGLFVVIFTRYKFKHVPSNR